MSRKLSSIPRYPLFTQSTTFNSSQEIRITGRQPKIQRWILGMITGSAPFFVILFCWMFVSLCINNLVRLYQYRRNRYRQSDTEPHDTEGIASKTDV